MGTIVTIQVAGSEADLNRQPIAKKPSNAHSDGFVISRIVARDLTHKVNPCSSRPESACPFQSVPSFTKCRICIGSGERERRRIRSDCRRHDAGARLQPGIQHRTSRTNGYRSLSAKSAIETFAWIRRRKAITLLRPLILDLGAVAKGLAIDMAARELRSFPSFAINAGGDLYLGGFNPQGSPWSIGIRHPRERRCTDRYGRCIQPGRMHIGRL